VIDDDAALAEMLSLVLRSEGFQLSQPTVSHHMKLLVDAGLITREQRGKWAYYRIAPTTLAAMARALTPT